MGVLMGGVQHPYHQQMAVQQQMLGLQGAPLHAYSPYGAGGSAVLSSQPQPLLLHGGGGIHRHHHHVLHHPRGGDGVGDGGAEEQRQYLLGTLEGALLGSGSVEERFRAKAVVKEVTALMERADLLEESLGEAAAKLQREREHAREAHSFARAEVAGEREQEQEVRTHRLAPFLFPPYSTPLAFSVRRSFTTNSATLPFSFPFPFPFPRARVHVCVCVCVCVRVRVCVCVYVCVC